MSDYNYGLYEDVFGPDEDFDLSKFGYAQQGANLGGDTGIKFNIDDVNSIIKDPKIFESFAALYPAEAELLNDPEMQKLIRQQALTQSGQNAVANIGPQGDTGVQTQSADASGIKGVLQQFGKAIEDLTGIKGLDAAKYAAIIAAMKMAYDDAERARKEAKGTPFKSSSGYKTVTGPGGVTGFKKAAEGGIMSLGMAQGRYLGGHSDGMADKVPANIDGRRPAALSDGEFVIPADVVSHLGNGNSNAGAKRLYEMMDRIRGARTGNTKQGKQINPNKFLPR